MNDVEMQEADPQAVDMGYEDCQPMRRRGSMTHEEECQRRASIKAIMADNTISPMAKRRSIQHLMDGRRNSINGGASVSSYHSSQSGSTCSETPDLDSSEPYGLGYENPENGTNYAISNEQTMRTEQTRPHCPHYDRKCTLIAPCCGAAFGCRICHDDCPVLPPKINNGGRRYHRSASLPSSFTAMPPVDAPDNIDTHHTIDRFAVREVICRECFTRQSSKT